jgi:protoporphyrinogen oxidase
LLKHPDFSQTIDRLRKQLPSLAGNGYRGIGVPDCIRSGQDAAKQVLNL